MSFVFILGGFYGIYETTNKLISSHDSGKIQDISDIPKATFLYVGIGIILAVIGAILYYKVFTASITDIIQPHHPVENPITYGIGMIITSLIFSFGLSGSVVALEDGVDDDYYDNGKSIGILISYAIISVVLIVYLILKSMLILH